MIAGRAPAGPSDSIDLPKDERLGIKKFKQTEMCSVRRGQISCASIIAATAKGNIIFSREIGALKIPGTTSIQRLEVGTRRTLRNGQAFPPGNSRFQFISGEAKLGAL
ncbi:hypothetical protein OS189_08350 [Sulfitobacter sp. F26169L]|nr:hypothetical protein [Sulfitobacter sp. F26169L]